MNIVVSASESMKEELLSGGLKQDVLIEWVSSSELFNNYTEADAYIDILFDGNVETLMNLLPKPVFVNSVSKTLEELPERVIRFNGWPGFLRRNVLEASIANKDEKKDAEDIIACFNKKIIWAPNTAGFISARVIACIINEAYLTLDEGVSTKADIDTAMKLGTNYPYGPFEWSTNIGIANIVGLLKAFNKKNKGYLIADSLLKETI